MEFTKLHRRYFRDMFRDARQTAFKDAEGFQQILFALEKFGMFLSSKTLDLGKYERDIGKIVSESPLSRDIPEDWRALHFPFDVLYKLVREARNDALHQGAYARHLTNHAVQLSLLIEDALMSSAQQISDFMVHEVVTAKLWQPVSFARQQMLANSFSYLPIQTEEGWHLLSDSNLARYLRPDRKTRMAEKIENAIRDGLILEPAERCRAVEKANEVIKAFADRPLLVFAPSETDELLGIVTAFDLL